MMNLASLFYHLAFLPAVLFPVVVASGPVVIHPGGSPNECLDVRGAVFENGTPVQM